MDLVIPLCHQQVCSNSVTRKIHHKYCRQQASHHWQYTNSLFRVSHSQNPCKTPFTQNLTAQTWRSLPLCSKSISVKCSTWWDKKKLYKKRLSRRKREMIWSGKQSGITKLSIRRNLMRREGKYNSWRPNMDSMKIRLDC